MSNAIPAHKRILLKLSGEALMGDDQFGINRATIERMVAEIVEVTKVGVQVAVVIGGGNIFRGVAGGSVGMDRATADYMGMLATVMNALALADAMDKQGLTARVMSAIGIEQVVEPYVRPKALQYLEEGKVVVFAAGTGNPSSPPTRPLRCVVPKSAPKWCSRPPRWMACTRPTRSRILRPRATTSWLSTRPSRATWASWMPRLSRCAATRSCRFACSPSSSPAHSSAWSWVKTKALWCTLERFAATCPQRNKNMTIADIKKNTETKMGQSIEALKNNLAACVPAVPTRAAGCHPCRVLRLHGASVPGGQCVAAGRAHHQRAALGKEHGAKVEKAIRESDLGLNPLPWAT
jgi:hypothetical protein